MGQLIGISQFYAMQELQAKELSQDIVSYNDFSSQYGLALTYEQARELVDTRNRALSDYGRIELGTGTAERIINSFCQSPVMSGDNYAENLNTLLETFYYIKYATYDRISDGELIALMREKFDGYCAGNAELLKSKFAEIIAAQINGSFYGANEPEQPDATADENGDDGEDGGDYSTVYIKL